MAAAEELVRSDKILYREGIFSDWKVMLNYYRATLVPSLDQNWAKLEGKVKTAKNTDELKNPSAKN